MRENRCFAEGNEMPRCRRFEPHQLIEKFRSGNVREAIEQISRRLERISEDGLETNEKGDEIIWTKIFVKEDRHGGNWCFQLAKRTAKKRLPRRSKGSECRGPEQ